jgi:hypothetical protein
MQHSEHLILKLFMGVPLTSEIRMHLAGHSSQKLQQTIYRGKEYFGLFLQEPQIFLHQLHFSEQEIKKTLSSHCPLLETESLPIYIFPQLFIA